jgi:ABC-2 type transport system ATP-binding protein
MIEARHLSKSYGATRAVNDLSFDVEAGVVTGFLGPNGAGKSTTLRMILGLDRPSSGTVTIDGRSYHDLRWPLREVGALIDAKAVHPGRTAHNHLLSMAQSNAIPASRVTDVLETVGLASVANRRVGTFSLGMSQRLGIAGALLGDPGVLLFDEPVNGLDPEGILWVRTLLKSLAKDGRTIFFSSHLMSEMAQTATNVVVIGKGSLIADTSVEDFIASNTEASVLVRTPAPDALIAAIEAAGGSVTAKVDGSLLVMKLDAARIGDAALAAGAAIHELTPQLASLEDVFMELTSDSTEFHAAQQAPS